MIDYRGATIQESPSKPQSCFLALPDSTSRHSDYCSVPESSDNCSGRRDIRTDPFRLSIQGFLINSLPLLPLSISLYLMGAGHRRSRRELKILPYICNSLPFFSVLCGVILPAILLSNVYAAMAETAANKLTPYQQELISSSRIAPALIACIITGIGFFLISRQMQRLFAKYGVSCDQFFGERMA